MINSPSTLDEAIKHYIQLGIAITPLYAKEKRPRLKSWTAGIKDIAEASAVFKADDNIGFVLGDPSSGLIDLDFDWHEASKIADHLFADCPAVHRDGAGITHRLIRTDNSGQTIQLRLTAGQTDQLCFKKAVVLEVRANGGQTMMPPSVHPSGVTLKWLNGMPTSFPSMPWLEIVRKTNLCAFLAVILRCYPRTKGNRDNICMALCGALLRAGFNVDEADELTVFVASLADDEEADKRRKASGTLKKVEANEPTTGLHALCSLLGVTSLQNTLNKWLTAASPRPHDFNYVSGHSEVANDLEKAVQLLNTKFFVVENEGGLCRVVSFKEDISGDNQHRKTLTTQSFSDFKNRYMNQKIVTGNDAKGNPIYKPLGNFWLDHPNRRQYERIEFIPKGTVPENTFNLWQGFNFEPQQGSWQKMEQHIWQVLAKRDKEAFDYIIKWVAWSVQNPDKPAEVALVLRGGKGTGKGTFCRWVKNLFGQHGLHIVSAQHLTGRFNGHLRDCVMLFADEAVLPNDKDAEAVLKGLITEPTIAIENKGKDLIQVPNHLHVMMASNSGWVISASADERRFAVFDASTEAVKNFSWFKEVNTEMENGGAAAMLYFLQNLELGDWHPRRDIPANTALSEQMQRSLRGGDRAWFDLLYDGEVPGEWRGERVFLPSPTFQKMAKLNQTSAGRFLKAMGCEKVRNGGRGWLLPPLQEARKQWNISKFEYNWEGSVDWVVVPRQPGTEDAPF